MSRKSTFWVAAILLVATIGMAGAIDYSFALGPNGQLGLGFGVNSDMDDAIVNAVVPNGDGVVIGNFRDVPAGARDNLASIESVAERMGGG